MSIQAINSTNNNLSFQGRTKKTYRGNEYQTTNFSRNTGATVGLLSGALAAKIQSNRLKTSAGNRDFVNAANNIGKSLKYFGNVGERNAVSHGIRIVSCGMAILGAVVGGVIGKVVDNHNNTKRAKLADNAAK